MMETNSIKFIPVIRNGKIRYKVINKDHPRWKRYSFGIHKIVEADIPLRKPILVNDENLEGE
jgi:hypothetical protein